MKNTTKRLISIFLILALMVCSLAGCGGGTGGKEPTGSPSDSVAPAPGENEATGTNTVPGTVLNIVAPEDMPVLTPMNNMTSAGYTLSFNVYEGLVQANKGDWNDIQPCLAEDWTISEDGLEYVFYLRKGVKFHDGSDFNAADVIATFDYMKADQPSYFTSIASYEATDDYTVAVHMSQPYAYFINILGSLWFKMLSAEALEAYGDTDIRCAVGTGPYYIESHATGERVVTKAFQDYWNPEAIAYIETINYNIITDNNTAFLALQNGQVDMMLFASALQYTVSQAASNLQTFNVSNPCNWILGLNTNVAPLDKLEVRQAIDCFLDKEAINMAGFDGLGFATNSTYVEESGVYADMGHTYDIEKGKALLASVGLEPSDITLTLKCATDSSQKAMAENIQAQLLSVGMNIELVTLDVGPLNETRVTGDFEMNLYDTGGNLYNPMGSINQMVISTGVVCTSFFKDTLPEFQAQADEMVIAANGAATADQANKLGQEVMEFYQAQIPWIPLVGGYLYHICNANVNGIVIDNYIGGYPLFQYAYIAE